MIVLKKTIVSNLPEAFLVMAMGFQIRFATELLFTLFGILALSIWSFRLIANIIQRDYIILNGEQVTLQDNFRKWTFSQSDVEYIALNYAPFSRSYFKLKNGLKRRFDPWKLNKVDTEKLQIICNKIK